MDFFADFFSSDFTSMLVRFVLCTFVNWILVHFLYYPKSKRRDFYFTFMLIGVAIFMIVYFMIFCLEDMKAKTSMGVGIGLFGIFSIMRYRTDAMPVREMTYLFVMIAVSVTNAIASTSALGDIIATDIIILVVTLVCEHRLKVHATKLIQYDRIALITPDKREELIADLEERTGLEIIKVEVGAIDFLKDMAMLNIYYKGNKERGSNSVDHKLKFKRDDFK